MTDTFTKTPSSETGFRIAEPTSPNIVFPSPDVGPIMTIHRDGRITLSDDAKPTEAAAACIEAMGWMLNKLIADATAVAVEQALDASTLPEREVLSGKRVQTSDNIPNGKENGQ